VRVWWTHRIACTFRYLMSKRWDPELGEGSHCEDETRGVLCAEMALGDERAVRVLGVLRADDAAGNWKREDGEEGLATIMETIDATERRRSSPCARKRILVRLSTVCAPFAIALRR
jgi:hypothetical protein